MPRLVITPADTEKSLPHGTIRTFCPNCRKTRLADRVVLDRWNSNRYRLPKKNVNYIRPPNLGRSHWRCQDCKEVFKF